MLSSRTPQQQTALDELLVSNIRSGLPEGVQIAVKNGAGINYKSNGTPVIMLVIENINYHPQAMLEILRFLLQRGAACDAVDWNGHSALVAAATRGYKEAVQILLEFRASVILPNCISALTVCDKTKYPDIVKLLEEAKEQQSKQHLIDLAFKANVTAGILAGVEACLERNTRVQFEDLLSAINSQDASLFAILMRYYNKDLLPINDHRLLTTAAEKGFMDGVTMLLSHIPVNTVNAKGDTVLHIAARHGHEQIARLLLDANARIDILNLASKTPLQEAAAAGKSIIVNLLMERIRPENEKQNNDADSPLYIAIVNGHEEIVRCILEQQANRKKPIPHLRELLKAVKNNNQPIKELINLYITKQLELNNSFHQYVKNRDYAKVSECLGNGAELEFVAEGENTSALSLAALNDDLPMLELLLNAGAELEAKTSTKQGYSALHVAANENKFNAARFLLERNANPNVTSKGGDTPLHLAAGGDKAILELLVFFGGDINYANPKFKRVALHYAVKDRKNINVEYMLAIGAKVDAVDYGHINSLHVAASQNDVDIVRMLLIAKAKLSLRTKENLTALRLCYVNANDHRQSALLIVQAYANSVNENDIKSIIEDIITSGRDRFFLMANFIAYLAELPNIFTPACKTNFIACLKELPADQRTAIKEEINKLLESIADPTLKKKLCDLALNPQQNNPLSVMLNIKKSVFSKTCAPASGTLKKIAEIKDKLKPNDPDPEILNDIMTNLKEAGINQNFLQMDNCLDLLHAMHAEAQGSDAIPGKLRELDLYFQSQLGRQFIVERFEVICRKNTGGDKSSESLANNPYLKLAKAIPSAPASVPTVPVIHHPPGQPQPFYSAGISSTLFSQPVAYPHPPSYQEAVQLSAAAVASAPPATPPVYRLNK